MFRAPTRTAQPVGEAPNARQSGNAVAATIMTWVRPSPVVALAGLDVLHQTRRVFPHLAYWPRLGWPSANDQDHSDRGILRHSMGRRGANLTAGPAGCIGCGKSDPSGLGCIVVGFLR